MSSAKSKDPKLVEELRKTIDIAIKLKAAMHKRSIRRARCVCPRCGGMIWGALAGPRSHLHMSCRGTCGMVFME